MVSALDLFSLLFLSLQSQQPSLHIFAPPPRFIYFLELFISNIHPKTGFEKRKLSDLGHHLWE
jgi:hypothetical protein